MDQRRRNVSDQAALPSMRPPLASSPTRPHVILVSSTPDSISKAPLSARPFGDAFGETPLAVGATESPFFPAEPGTSQRSGKETSPARPTERAAPYAPGDLEQALRRRRDWTPPPLPGDAPRHIHSDSSADCEAWSSPTGAIGGVGRTSAAGNVFQTLHDSFRYQTDGALPPAHALGGSDRTAGGAEAYLTRRKPLEPICLGDTGMAAAAKETTKTKTKTTRAKKARTITELAVAAYADADPSLDSDDEAARAGSRVASAKRPLEPDDAVLAAADEAAFTGLHERNLGLPNSRLRKLKKPATTKAKATAAAKTKTTDAPSTGAAAPKRKAATKRGQTAAAAAARRPRPPVLLSPRSALLESTAQDFLFGTSSQLAGDESPTFLRALQAAMQASNQDGGGGGGGGDSGGSSYAAEAEVSTVDLTGRAASPPAAAASASRLWAVGARGHDGSVAFDTVVDLEEEIAFPEDPHEVLRAMAQQAKADAKDAAQQARHVEMAGPRPAGEPAAEAATARSDSPPAPAQKHVEKRPPQQANEPPARLLLAGPGGASTAEQPPAARSRPDFAVLTTAQLASKVASYGFKPMRARRAMLALLDQCWDASTSTGTGTGTGTGMGTVTQGLAPRTAAAPLSTKATATAAAAAAVSSRVVLEIADSESEGEAVVRDAESDAEHGDDVGTAGSVAGSDVSGDEGAAGQGQGQGQAFGYITKAVLAARRTDDPSQPSWHEKMLMYDTILLEPFTAWLNEEGLRAAGYDTDAEGAVSALDVKRWCEAKSVCCTWRTNQNGKERKL